MSPKSLEQLLGIQEHTIARVDSNKIRKLMPHNFNTMSHYESGVFKDKTA